MNKVTVQWFWPVFRLFSNRYRTHLDGFHPLMTIVTVKWFYLVFRLYYVISYSDLYRRTCCSHGWVILTRISVTIQQIWPGTAPSDSSRKLSPIDDRCQGWMIFTSYFAYITSYPNLACLEGVYALMKKSRLGEFDSYFTFYPIDMAGISTIGLTHLEGFYPLCPSSRLNDLPRISLILRRILVGLVSSDLSRRRSRFNEQSHGWVIMIRTCISLIIQQIWPGTAPPDSPRLLPPIDHCHGWVILSFIPLILRHILIGLVYHLDCFESI